MDNTTFLWDLKFDPSSRVLSFAADQLKRYLTRMGLTKTEGAPEHFTLTVKDLRPVFEEKEISLEENPIRDDELDDAYEVEVGPESAMIAGQNERSVVLGVYAYLREIGCGFLKPGAEYEIIPELDKKEAFYASLLKRASMRHRGLCIEGADSIENILETIDWLPKVGYNSFFLQFKYPHEFMRRWYSHVNNETLGGENWTLEKSIAADKIFDEAMKDRGILQHRVGHGWTGEVLGSNEMGWGLGEEIAPELMEMVASIGGKKELVMGRPTFTNLCYTRQDSIDRFAAKVLDYARTHQDVDYVHVWLADLPNHVCECENCRKSILTDQYIVLLNEIDRRLTAENLSTRIVFLLYQELCYPPEKETLNNPDRFVLMFAPISRTFLKSYKDAGELSEIPPYVPNHMVMPHAMEDYLAYLKGWQEKVSCDSFVYDYHLGKAHYGDAGYVHLSRIIAEDLKTNKALGLNGFNSCQELRAGFPNALPNYVMGRIGFDTDLDFDEIAANYYWAAYGERWAEILNYLSKLSDLYEIDYFVGYRDAADASMEERFERAALLGEAFSNLAANELKKFEEEEFEKRRHLQYDADPEWRYKSVQKRFYEELKAHGIYVNLLSEALRKRCLGEDSSEAYTAFCRFVRENEPRLQKALDAYRALEVSRNYTKLKEK